MTKEEIVTALRERGVEFDARWSRDRLEALLEGEPASEGVEVVVMHKTGIQLEEYVPARWRGVIPQGLYDEICALDDAAEREHRLLKIG